MRTQALHKESDENQKHPISGKMAHKENLELPGTKTYEPKYIRGPTKYQTGYFRTAKTVETKQEEAMGTVDMKPENGERPSVRLRQWAESNNADFVAGIGSDDSHVFFSGQKNSQTDQVNSFKEKRVDMVRAKSLHGKDLATYSEKIESAFCQVLPKGTTTEHFMRYLEEAALDAETADIAKVFPFLKISEDQQKLTKLLNVKTGIQGKNELEGGVLQEQVNDINRSIELLRAKIYEDRLKKVQFKKRIELLLQESLPTNESEEEFWLWVLLKKLLKAVEEALESTPTEIGNDKPMV